MPNDSMRTVLVALGSGLGVALAKVVVAAFTGSTALAAEAAHSLADTGNDLVTFVGPGRAWVVARLDVDDDLRGAQVKSLVRGIESGMKRESENVYRVDVVPIGAGRPAPA